jgi:hypothetical protein
VTSKGNLYDYDHFRELGRIARIAKIEKMMAPRAVPDTRKPGFADGNPRLMNTTRTQRAFWVLGWEAEDDLQKKVKPNETPSV